MVAKVLLSLVFFGLVACGGHTRAPIEDRNAESPYVVYSVNKGDTLYSIAFRYGLDFRQVASAFSLVQPSLYMFAVGPPKSDITPVKPGTLRLMSSISLMIESSERL